MAQEFRTFTQRVTDKEKSATKIFNVQAKTLVDQFGNDVVDANGKKIWFPVTFNPADAIAFGNSLAAKPKVAALFDLGRNIWQGGPWDLQRSYNGQSNAPFAEVFTRAASYALGLIGAAGGFSQTNLMMGGGLHNLLVNSGTAGPNFGNNPRNPPFIEQGFRDYSRFAPPAVIPNNSFQGNPAFAGPAGRFSASFDRSSNGLPDNFDGLAASVANGSITPAAGFTNRQAGAALQATPDQVAKSAPSTPNGWFDSMVRNGEFDRITGNSGVAPPPIWSAVPTTPAFQPDAVYAPDGNFIGNFPTASRLTSPFGQHGPNSGPQIVAGKNGLVTPNAIENRRYLTRRSTGQSRESAFDTGTPAVPFVQSNEGLSPDRPSSLDSRFGNWTTSPGGSTPRNPNLPLPPAEPGKPPGIFNDKPIPLWVTPPPIRGSTDLSEAPGISTKPIRYVSRRDGNPPPAFVSDAGAPAARFVLPDQLNSSSDPADWAAALAGLAVPPQRRGAFVSGNDALSRATGAKPGQFQGPTASALLEYIQHLNELSANPPQAPRLERGAPGASLALSDSSTSMGGLAGRLAALAGIDPDNPDQLAPPPGGLLARLLAIRR